MITAENTSSLSEDDGVKSEGSTEMFQIENTEPTALEITASDVVTIFLEYYDDSSILWMWCAIGNTLMTISDTLLCSPQALVTKSYSRTLNLQQPQ